MACHVATPPRYTRLTNPLQDEVSSLRFWLSPGEFEVLSSFPFEHLLTSPCSSCRRSGPGKGRLTMNERDHRRGHQNRLRYIKLLDPEHCRSNKIMSLTFCKPGVKVSPSKSPNMNAKNTALAHYDFPMLAAVSLMPSRHLVLSTFPYSSPSSSPPNASCERGAGYLHPPNPGT